MNNGLKTGAASKLLAAPVYYALLAQCVATLNYYFFILN